MRGLTPRTSESFSLQSNSRPRRRSELAIISSYGHGGKWYWLWPMNDKQDRGVGAWGTTLVHEWGDWGHGGIPLVHGRGTLGENCALAANQSVDCRATTLFTIGLNSAKVWNKGFNWPEFGVWMHKKSPYEHPPPGWQTKWKHYLPDLLCNKRCGYCTVPRLQYSCSWSEL